MGFPYGQVSVLGNALDTYGLSEEGTTDGLALDTFGFITGILETTCWALAVSEGITATGWTGALSDVGATLTAWAGAASEGLTLTAWSPALAEGLTLTSWSPALAEGVTLTSWIDGISEIPPASSCS